jgi:Kef-type K+ transport system membrane component KefB/mannitol/fructose-specific phosphotransferase system IIA component (Ntr-type)
MLEFGLILGASKLLGLLFQKFKQPTITADLLIGLILGPTVLKRISPEFSTFLFPTDHTQFLMLETIAWTGIFFLLLETGLEVNFASIWKQKKQASLIAVSGIAIPLVLCIGFLFLIPDSYLAPKTSKSIFSIFVAVILTISAMPIAIRALYDLNILKSDLGFLVVSALTINDFIGWILFTIILGVFTHGSPDILYILKFIVLTLSFCGFALFLLRNKINHIIRLIKEKSEDGIGLTISFITILGMLFGAITLSIGLHALLGFFLAGIVVGGSEFLSEKERQVINRMVYSIFVPFFFVIIGLKIDFLADFNLFLLLFLSVLGILSKFFGAWVGAFLSKNPKKDLMPIAVAHTAGGEMQIVIGMLALETGLISKPIFVAIVGSAIISTILLGPWLSYVLRLRFEYSFLAIFKKENIIADLRVNNKNQALEHISEKASKICHLSQDELLKSIFSREELMSTAIGNSIAVPDARLSCIKKPVVLYAKSDNPLEWDSPDGLPVHMIFLVLTPLEQTNIQLKLLRNIALMFKGSNLDQKLISSNNINETWQVFKEHHAQMKTVT